MSNEMFNQLMSNELFQELMSNETFQSLAQSTELSNQFMQQAMAISIPQ